MAKKKTKKKVAEKAVSVAEPVGITVTEVPSDNTRITVLENRLDRIVRALSTAKPITKDM